VQLGDRLAFVGVVVGLVGVGVAIRYPKKRWIANIAFAFALVFCGFWVGAEYQERACKSEAAGAPKPNSTVTTTGDCNAANTGDGSSVSSNCGDTPKKKK